MHFDNFITFSPSSQTAYAIPLIVFMLDFMMRNIIPHGEQAMIIWP